MKKIRNFISLILGLLQSFWNWLPKTLKVAIYLAGALILDQLTKDLNLNFLNFIPVAYRLILFNLLEVFIVEGAKDLRKKAKE